MAPKQKQRSAKQEAEQKKHDQQEGEQQPAELAAGAGAQGAPSDSTPVVPRSLLDMPKAWLAALTGSERLNAAARRALFHTAGTAARLLMVHAPPSTTRRLYRYASGPMPSKAWPAALTRFLQQCAVPPPAADGSGGGLELVLACSTLDDALPDEEAHLAGASLSTFSHAALPPDAIKPLFTSLQLRRLALSSQSMQALGLPQWTGLCSMRFNLCQVLRVATNEVASPDFSFVPPPNVRALRLDVHFEQGADSTVMCALARPFAPHLEHLCLKIAACGEEHDGWFDIIEFWSDRTAAALLVLCPHLRRLDFPLEMKEDLWNELAAHKSLEHLSALGFVAPRWKDTSKQWRDKTCESITCIETTLALGVAHVGRFPKLPRLERLVVRGSGLRLSNSAEWDDRPSQEVLRVYAGLDRLEQWAQPRQEQPGTVLRVVPVQASDWSPVAEDRLVRLQVSMLHRHVGVCGSTLGHATRLLLKCCEGPVTHLQLDSSTAPWRGDALKEVAVAVDEVAGGGGGGRGVHTLCLPLWDPEEPEDEPSPEPSEASDWESGESSGSWETVEGGEEAGGGGSAAKLAAPEGAVMGALPTSIRTLSVFFSMPLAREAGAQQPEQPTLWQLAPQLLPLLRQRRASPLRVVVCTDAELSAANKALIEEVAARQPHVEVGYFVRPAKQRRGG